MYCWFVDDVFYHIRNKQASDHFGDQLNALHPALRFTREDECDNNLPFMDVKVMREDTGIATSIHRKKTFTGLFTPWDSYSPTSYKMNLVRCLAHRARRICSQSTLGNELQVLRSIFMRNGYPGHVLDKYLQLSPPSSPSFIGPERCPVIIRLPWVGSISTHLERKIRTSVRLAYFSVQVYAVYHTSRAFVLPKDKLPTPFPQ